MAGTYLIAAAAAGGEIEISGIRSEELTSLTALLEEGGAVVYREQDRIYLRCQRPFGRLCAKTGPYPDFPTDLQSPLLALMSVSGGGTVEETVFESRFKTALELNKMGAAAEGSGKMAKVREGRRLRGCRVRAWDLRGGAALVAAGLAAEGTTLVEQAEYIFRGYEDICRDLSSLGGTLWYRESAT